MLELAWSLQFESLWGRRTEDPFRGLRAGPVRYSPLFISRRQVTPHGSPTVVASFPPQSETEEITKVCPLEVRISTPRARNDGKRRSRCRIHYQLFGTGNAVSHHFWPSELK